MPSFASAFAASGPIVSPSIAEIPLLKTSTEPSGRVPRIFASTALQICAAIGDRLVLLLQTNTINRKPNEDVIGRLAAPDIAEPPECPLL